MPSDREGGVRWGRPSQWRALKQGNVATESKEQAHPGSARGSRRRFQPPRVVPRPRDARARGLPLQSSTNGQAGRRAPRHRLRSWRGVSRGPAQGANQRADLLEREPADHIGDGRTYPRRDGIAASTASPLSRGRPKHTHERPHPRSADLPQGELNDPRSVRVHGASELTSAYSMPPYPLPFCPLSPRAS